MTSSKSVTATSSGPDRTLPPPPDDLYVLVAEDDAAMRDLIVTTLSRDGARVSHVDNGITLIDRLSEDALDGDLPGVVICDIRMPGLGGLGALTAIRRNGLELPVILITAFGDDEVHASARRMGAVAVFDKPFDLDDLRTAVAHFARRGSVPEREAR